MENLFLWIASALVGISKAGFGAGVGIAAVPLMTMVIPPMAMLGTLLPLFLIGDIFSLIHYPGKQHLRNLAMLIPGGILGIVLGAFVLNRFSLSGQLFTYIIYAITFIADLKLLMG